MQTVCGWASLVKVTRLTRAQSQARTRADLLEIATTLFLRDGYAATSLEKVAEAAGYTRGAVYSNFRNKDELCLAVLDGIRAQRMTEVVQLLGGGDDVDVGETLDRFEVWATRIVGDPTWTRLEIEFAAHASRDHELSSQLADRLTQLVELLTAGVRTMCAADGIDLPVRPDEAAVALLSLGVGLGLFRAIAPALPISALTNTVRALVRQ